MGVGVGCDTPERVTRLEKQVQELQAKVSKDQAVIDYDLQAKCSKDAKTWFNENWGRDKDTQLLDETNHFNKAQSKCFVVVEYHYSRPPAPSWNNSISMWDVNENVKYADYSESHYIDYKRASLSQDEVVTCACNGKSCKTLEEFNGLISAYTSN